MLHQMQITARKSSNQAVARINRRHYATVVAIGLLWLLFGVCVSVAMADSCTEATAPSGKDLATTPYVVRLDARWCDVNGYRPVRVEIRRRGNWKVLDERTVSVEIAPFMYSTYDVGVNVEQEVTIPEGAQSAQVTIYLPQHRLYRGCMLSVREGGQSIKELDDVLVSWDNLGTNRDYNDAEPNILVIDYDAPALINRDVNVAIQRQAVDAGEKQSERKLPDLRRMVSVIPNEYSDSSTPGTTSDLATLESLRNWRRVLLIAPTDMQQSWLGLSGMDLVFISWPDLQRMQRENAAEFKLLESWLLAGGNIVVSGIGDRFEELQNLEELFEMESRAAEPAGDIDYRGWQVPALSSYGFPVAMFQQSRAEITQNYVTVSGQQAPVSTASRREREAAAKRSAPFVIRELSYGSVTAFAGDAFAGDTHQWNWFFNSLTPERWSWWRRHGMSLRRENPDFWEFMIPNVGTAPVNAFRVLISAFVIVIGPVNFWLLKRAKRLGWILVTVPLGALVVIMSLFCYAVFTDGFRVQYRIRSLSRVDQRREHVVTWARQSYYAGLTPSSGFQFPVDAAVYMMDQMRTASSGYDSNGTNRSMAWGESQHLRSGYIAPRVTSQFMVVRSRPTQRGLQVKASDAGGVPSAINRLGTPLKRLYLCDSRGDLYAAADVQEGADIRFEKIDAKRCRDELQSYFELAPLQLPDSFDEQSYQNTVSMNSNYYYYGYNSGEQSLGRPLQAVSVLERELSRIRRAWPDAPQRQTYVAVVESDPEVPLGIRAGTLRLGLSIIEGEY